MTRPDHPATTLVDDGAASAEIRWWRADDAPVASFAATELQSYVREMSGAEVSASVAEPAGEPPDTLASALVVGDGEITDGALDPIGNALADAASDSFALVTIEEGIALGGTTHRGTLYATYALLEKLGIRFFAPDFEFYEGHAERVPSRSTVAVPPLDVVEEPSFRLRRKYVEEGYSHTTRTLGALIDWMAKTRHNVLVVPTDYENIGVVTWDSYRDELRPEIEKRGLALESGGHGFDSFLPPSEYRAEHPEWFVEGYNVFDVTQEAAVEEYVGNVVSHLEERPEISIFDAWPPDAASWPPRVVEAFGSAENAYAHVVDRLEAAVPDAVTVEAVAYTSHLDPPDPEFQYGEDAVVDFAPFDRSYEVPISASAGGTNETYVDLMTEWREAFDGTLGLYEYYRKYSWHSLPVALPELIGRELPFYESIGLDAVGIYSEPADWIPYEVTHLLVAAMAWDADTDAEAYVAAYLDERYGPAADEMATYLDLVEDAGRTLFDQFRGSYDDEAAVSDARERYLEAEETLAGATAEVAEGSTAAFLIDRLAANAAFAVADTEISYYELTDQPERAALAKQRTVDLIREHRFDGVVLQAYWTVDRCLDLDVPEDAAWMRELYRDEW